MLPVSFHISARTEKEPWLYSDFFTIDSVRLKARSSASPRPDSATTFLLLVSIEPSIPADATRSATAAITCAGRQPIDSNLLRHQNKMHGISTASSIKPSSAERVPVIIKAEMLKPREKIRKNTVVLSLTRVNSRAEKGRVQTANSAKKLRLTNVDAGFGPWAKKLKSNQNCRAAHSDAITAPRCMPHARCVARSSVNALSPKNTIIANKNQRTASTPPRYA